MNQAKGWRNIQYIHFSCTLYYSSLWYMCYIPTSPCVDDVASTPSVIFLLKLKLSVNGTRHSSFPCTLFVRMKPLSVAQAFEWAIMSSSQCSCSRKYFSVAHLPQVSSSCVCWNCFFTVISNREKSPPLAISIFFTVSPQISIVLVKVQVINDKAAIKNLQIRRCYTQTMKDIERLDTSIGAIPNLQCLSTCGRYIFPLLLGVEVPLHPESGEFDFHVHVLACMQHVSSLQGSNFTIRESANTCHSRKCSPKASGCLYHLSHLWDVVF